MYYISYLISSVCCSLLAVCCLLPSPLLTLATREFSATLLPAASHSVIQLDSQPVSQPESQLGRAQLNGVHC